MCKSRLKLTPKNIQKNQSPFLKIPPTLMLLKKALELFTIRYLPIKFLNLLWHTSARYKLILIEIFKNNIGL